MGHGLLGEDAAPSISSPLRRRSVLAQRAIPARVDIVNDDSTERAGSRRSLGLSAPQVRDGIAECIKLNTQNKINIKNAFSLSMIDFMMYMVKNRDEGLGNLQVASTTLDVSAKIYGLRVDSLHHDTMKMVGHFDQQEKDNKDEEADNDNENGSINEMNQPERKKKKKKSSTKILVTIESLQCKPEKISLEPPMFGDTDCQTTDMLYEAMLPKHCSKNLNLHPYKDVIFDEEIPNNVNKENTSDNNQQQWPPIKMDTSKNMMSMFENFTFLNWDPNDVESITSSQETQDDHNESLAFDINASLPAANDNDSHDNRLNFFDINDDDNDENQVAQFQEVNRVPDQIVDVADVLNMVEKDASKQLEYSYAAISDVIHIRHHGKSSWTVKNQINRHAASRLIGACRQDATRKKKELVIGFSPEIYLEHEQNFRISTRVQKPSQKRRPPGWVREKLVESLNGNFESGKIIKYKLYPDKYIKTTKTTNANDEGDDLIQDRGIEINDYNDNHDIGGGGGPNDDFGQRDDDNHHMDLDDNHNMDEDTQHNDDLQNNDDNVFTQGGFVGDNLVEAPKLTEKIYIPFSQRAKKLDMRNLKKTIWKNLNTNNNDNTENNDDNDTADSTVRDIKLFSNVFEKLPSQLNKNDASELTCPLAFVSLLHLANEKNLRIISNDDYSDLSIFQDDI